jgi:hypothetical protein
MAQRVLLRWEDGLRKLNSAATTGYLTDEDLANRRLGRLLEKNRRVAGAFQVRVERLLRPEDNVRLKITWERDENWNAW